MVSLDVVCICGPSGVGKSTMVKMLMCDHGKKFGFSVSHTTRQPRGKEVDGVEYHFVNEREFMEAKKRGEFLETVPFSGNLYGTSKSAVKAVVEEKGKTCIMDVNIRSVEQVNFSELQGIQSSVVTDPRIGVQRSHSLALFCERKKIRIFEARIRIFFYYSCTHSASHGDL
jgi:guanylate kinase